MLTTNLPENIRESSEEAISVIHAPESFSSWVGLRHYLRRSLLSRTN
jgi:hypothetical protein